MWNGTWEIKRTRPVDLTYGRALPAFIHNGSYYLSTVDVYADGAIDCWGFVDRALLDGKLSKGWIATQPPLGAVIGIYSLGRVSVAAAQWCITCQDLAAQVDHTLRQLNPDGVGLIDMEGSATEIRDGCRYAKLGVADKTPYRHDASRHEIVGAQVPIFLKQDNDYVLTRWFVYADQQCELGYGTGLMAVDDVQTMIANGQVTTSVPDGVWISVPGLGRFQTAKGSWSIEPDERVREVQDLGAIASGQKGSIQRCMDAHQAYDQNPNKTNRAELQLAYESVPQHLRIYCGDMDTRDLLIRQILYGENPEDY
ncbi:MAG: hypothetical protein AAGI69_08615 [Cyanobacteria bacterium P01_H01_bin.21]